MNADFRQQMDRLDTQGITATNADKDNIFGLENRVHYIGKNLLVKQVMSLFQRHNLRMQQTLANGGWVIL